MRRILLVLPFEADTCPDIFKFDPNFLENEEKYKAIKAEILGEDSDDDSGSEESSEDSDDDQEGKLRTYSIDGSLLKCFPLVAEDKEGIEDRTGTNVVNLRRIIYLTIMNALNYEEAVHKLLKVQLGEGEEVRPDPQSAPTVDGTNEGCRLR